MIYNTLLSSSKAKKSFALLIDPDKNSLKEIRSLSSKAQQAGVDCLLLGGSLIRSSMEKSLKAIKESTSLPVLLFPGSVFQFCSGADGILLLSLISGRNPDFLIGNHVVAAQAIKQSGMDVIPTGYILIESGAATSVQYMSNTMPIPRYKTDIVVATAIAGEQLGLKAIYLEAGSGAKFPVSTEIISEVFNSIQQPVIVGGGLKTPSDVMKACSSGATMVVVGNALEKSPSLLAELVSATYIE